MFQPVNDLKVTCFINNIPADTVFGFEFYQPSLNKARSVVVVGVQKAREHSRGRARPPGVVNYGPKLNKQEAGIP
jgi:hypothetical protein